MKTLTKIGVMSVAKIQALITGALYLLMGVIANIIGLKNPELIMGVGIQLGINALITYTLAGLIGGFVIGALIAYLYNLLAPRIGGIQIELR